jgi:hypothetical protein
MTHAAPSLVMLVVYWAYFAFLPTIFIVFVLQAMIAWKD